MIVNIFIPLNIELYHQGFLNGTFIANHDSIQSDNHTIIIDNEVEEEISSDVIGILNSEKYYFPPMLKEKSTQNWISIRTSPDLLVENLCINGSKIGCDDINLVLFDFLSVSKSLLLSNTNKSKSNYSNCIDCFVKKIKSINKSKSHKSSTYLYPLNILVLFMSLTFSILHTIMKKIKENLLTKLDIRSNFIDQLSLRINQLEKLSDAIKSKEKLTAFRITGMIFVDMSLGVIYFYIVYKWTLAAELQSQFKYGTDILANNVQDLLFWLRGAPAGLKLNQPLAEALSSFFSYHVYLCTLYISIASPMLAVLAHLFVFIGVFGISIQIALLMDCLNLAVLHIHCFYIYAARLHMLQMSLLGSQWRGFRGRKWNPLKRRVDARAEVRQRPIIKIVSAVGFTLVIFLLPTTSVYYAVFVFLRLCLLCFQGIASLLIWALNWNPISIFYLYVSGSSSIKGELHFEMDQLQKASSSLVLRMSTRTSPLRKVIEASHTDVAFPPVPSPHIGKMLQSLLYAKDLL